MALIHIDETSDVTTPSSGSGKIFIDDTAKIIVLKSSDGTYKASSHNASVASQGPGFATDTYITDSDILIPSFGVQAETTIHWKISALKTAAGVAGPTYNLRIGSNRTTADTARITFGGSAQTAAADSAIIEIFMTVRTVGAAGVLQAVVSVDHMLAATGFSTSNTDIIRGASAGFDNSALGGQYVGISIDAGASAAWTMSQVHVQANW